MKNIIALIFASITTLALTACVTSNGLRANTAQRIAGPAFMIDRQLQAGDFALTLYERIHDRGGEASIYIEGDYGDKISRPIFSTSPITPVALQLASRDKSKNVIYIARPCQYSQRKDVWKQTPLEGEKCDEKYTDTHRFAPEVIASYNDALDEIKRRWGIRSFRLYGHSGGGAIGALIAAERSDIISLTTVAGTLDTKSYEDTRKQPTGETFNLLNDSINPKSVAKKLASLPQYHYVGADDRTMPPSVLHAYLNAVGPTRCVHYKIIEENGYITGWADKWPSILKDKPTCSGAIGLLE